jgi:hypothetical protein
VRGRGSRRARPPLMQVRWPDVVKFNNRCNLLKHHRYLRPIMQPSDSTRKNLLCVSASSQHFPECNGPRYLLEQRRNWLMLQSRVLLHCCVLRMPCLPRGLRSALLRKASVLRNWLLRKWDARQPRSAFSRSPLMLQSRVLLHCCVLRMCAETNFSHPILRVESEGCIIGLK